MLKERIVYHPIFGRIRLNAKFSQVLDLEPFRQLAFKSQLGNKALSSEMLGAKHTRLMHSIGVMHLTDKLIDTCERKFSQYFSITSQDRETLELVALGHDVGHIAFSHSLEDKNMQTHEERTVQIFKDYAPKINSIFGYDITSKVISIFENNEKVKRKGIDEQEDQLDILFVFTKLLMGAIDCDRMEYLVTDRYMVFGEKLDFMPIFDHIAIVLLNDSPIIGFEKEAVPLIENMLFTRFDQYNSIYYAMNEHKCELSLKMYVKEAGWSSDYKERVTEYELLSHMGDVLRAEEGNTKKTRLGRIAEIVLRGERKNLFIKRFCDEKQYQYFMQRLYAVTDRRDIIITDKKTVEIYNPEKNRIYIRDEDGVVKDITEVSAKIQRYVMKLYFVMVDVSQAYDVDEKDAENIRKLFEDNPIEIEKKFCFPAMDFNDKSTCKQKLADTLRKMHGVEKIGKENIVHNCDRYFELPNSLPKTIAIRHRKTEKGESYFIKIPCDDGTSITKREEYEYRDITFEKFLQLATELLKLKGFETDGVLDVQTGIKIQTERHKFLATVCGSTVEFACDFSTCEYNEKNAIFQMLECEIKDGNDLALWCLTNHLKKFGFVETNKSKQAIARKLTTT